MQPNPIRITMQLGQVLRILRKERGWSQTQLGDKIGLSQERISAIERNPGSMSVAQLLTVLMALDAELLVQPRDTGRDRAAEPAPW